jgi:hypothetical protein
MLVISGVYNLFFVKNDLLSINILADGCGDVYATFVLPRESMPVPTTCTDFTKMMYRFQYSFDPISL